MSQNIGVEPQHLRTHFGKATARMVDTVFDDGADRALLLMRHSARTFDRSINDLLNRLTDHGRDLCREFGNRLPKDVLVRGYASPPERCMETAQIAIESHVAAGGDGGRTRPVEALGVFYALDQQKMWKGLSSAEGLADYVARWFAGAVAEDAMMAPAQAVQILLRALRAKMQTPIEGDRKRLDLCVSHDLTIYTMRHGLGLEPVSGPAVEFLDGLILFEREGRQFVRSQHGGEVEVTER